MTYVTIISQLTCLSRVPYPTYSGAFAAWLYGDPHMRTLDGYEYTFNGRGEYTLMKTNDGIFTCQGRFLQPKTTGNKAARGTVFVAIAAKNKDSDRVHVEADIDTNG